jgi:hypothetical protein
MNGEPRADRRRNRPGNPVQRLLLRIAGVDGYVEVLDVDSADK